MTFRQKLILKRTLIVLAILIALILVALFVGYTYLGRYVVYTEDGAYFSFNATESTVSEYEALTEAPESVVLVTGESIYEADFTGETIEAALDASDVNGIMVDYETLSAGVGLSSIEFSEEGYNTLVLEMRVAGSDILKTGAVTDLIARAKANNMKVIAIMSCLDDSEYALANLSHALPISGGALWIGEGGSYWLDPTNESVQDYLIGMMEELIDMGFDEILLNTFYFPESQSIVYNTGEYTRAELLTQAYDHLAAVVKNRCILGIYISNAAEMTHQAMYNAEHVYAYFASGASLKSYTEANPGVYLVFVTDSHDTRFADYGKISSDPDIVPSE